MINARNLWRDVWKIIHISTLYGVFFRKNTVATRCNDWKSNKSNLFLSLSMQLSWRRCTHTYTTCAAGKVSLDSCGGGWVGSSQWSLTNYVVTQLLCQTLRRVMLTCVTFSQWPKGKYCFAIVDHWKMLMCGVGRLEYRHQLFLVLLGTIQRPQDVVTCGNSILLIRLQKF